MDFDAQPGLLIEFDTGDHFRLAMITALIGKKKLVLHLADGSEMRTTPKDVTFLLGKASLDNLDGAATKLAGMEERISARKQDVEVPMLWEFTREETDPLSPQDLAELMFADQESETILAIIRALREDPIYFKSRRDGLYEPRSPEQAEALKTQQEARLKKENERQTVLEMIVHFLSLPREDRAAQVEEAMGEEDGLRNRIYLLQDFAATGEDYPRRQDAEELLDDLAALLGRQLKGRMGMKAFYLMVDLGLWEEHQNLWLHRYRIDPAFSAEVLQEAEMIGARPWEPEEDRLDLTYLTAVTIDGPTTRDFDDALSAQPTIEGGWELYIHIADPGAFVPLDSLLDKEARRRATSVYLPTETIPMFPRALSEGNMSLLAGEIRPALTTKITYNGDLEEVDTELLLTTIRVDRRLTYDDVDTLLESDEPGDRFLELLRNLRFIADECWSRRMELGAMSFDLPETSLKVDRSVDPPKVEVASVHTDTPSRTMVSELMILNNEVVGKFCARNEIPALFRTQEAPDQDLDDDEILSIPEGPARSFAQIRRMKSGDISTAPGLHYGLGLFHYAQASSPIRRYADLLCQHQIKAFLRNHPLPFDEKGVLKVLGSVGGAMGDATDAERNTIRYWLLYYFQNQKEPLDAIVVEEKDDRGERVSVFLTDSAFRANAKLHSPVPVGGAVQVTVERADPRHDALTLRGLR